MHTEEEARKKWCPFVRMMGVGQRGDEQIAITGLNSIALGTKQDEQTRNPEPSRCITSECMAWRIHDKQWEEKAGAIFARTGERPNAAAILKRKGFCGLAGTP